MQKKQTTPDEKCRHDLIAVSWIDAEEEAGWTVLEEEPSWIIKTVGFLISKGRKRTDFIVMANSHLPWGDEETYSGLTRIPMGMVLDVEVVARKVSCGGYVSQDQSRHTTNDTRPDQTRDDQTLWKRITRPPTA